jgi:signal peptidase I
MAELPKAARIARMVAFVMVGLTLMVAVIGPIILVAAALVPLCAAIGITRRRVWGAWGYAVYTLAQLVLSPVILLSSRGGVLTSTRAAMTAVFSFCIGVLFVFAGRAMAAAGFERGATLPWIVVSVLATVPVFFIEAFANPTGSMEDTLLVGDRILVSRSPRPTAKLGDVLVFIYPVDRKQTFIKRIVGMPGDRIRILNKVLYRNGVPVSEPYAVHKLDYLDSYRDNFPSEPNTPLFPPAQEMLLHNVVNGEVVVPAGKYFVMGDNRDQSLDSRYWGFVGAGDFIGKPLIIYDSADQSVDQLANRGMGAFHFSKTRWGRLFKVL